MMSRPSPRSAPSAPKTGVVAAPFISAAITACLRDVLEQHDVSDRAQFFRYLGTPVPVAVEAHVRADRIVDVLLADARLSDVTRRRLDALAGSSSSRVRPGVAAMNEDWLRALPADDLQALTRLLVEHGEYVAVVELPPVLLRTDPDVRGSALRQMTVDVDGELARVLVFDQATLLDAALTEGLALGLSAAELGEAMKEVAALTQVPHRLAVSIRPPSDFGED